MMYVVVPGAVAATSHVIRGAVSVSGRHSGADPCPVPRGGTPMMVLLMVLPGRNIWRGLPWFTTVPSLPGVSQVG
ncbi:hypothetical protein FrEUN1fDRAFT_1947 [Parafrankia sp. EUN1f]|nr:hypothetical protein FrEUN1fDRAFT_1947 [Parafrankia sp. EUN1f]